MHGLKAAFRRRERMVFMKRLMMGLGVVFALCLCVHAELRTWTTITGETVEGEYLGSAFDSVSIENADGKLIKVPLDKLSKEDRVYVELINPPRLSVDFLESSQQIFPKASPLWSDNSPIAVLDHTFGARIKKLDTKVYNHELTVEWYCFSKQVWDPKKYKMIQHYKSEPICFSKKVREFELRCDRAVRLYKIIVDQGTGAAMPRGQKFAESLVIVRDERGEIIAYNTTKNWLYDQLDKLEKLPVNAWLNDDCKRVHPSSPPPIKLGYLPDTY